MSFGFVYALSSMEMHDVIKIGFTRKSPSERARELSSSTGVPSQYIVEFYVEVPNPEEVEAEAHKRLAKHRVNKSREFFRVGVLHAAWAVYGMDKSFWIPGPQHLTDYVGDRLAVALSWVEQRKRAIEHHNGRCACCLSTSDLMVLHRRPELMGGTRELANLLCACSRCADDEHISFVERDVSNVLKEYSVEAFRA